ncbi:uncharacterized protein F5147DRAFT_652497 [Suillus discolor]|uniref:Uncharacterized protein n=1 Tax=Suillus discolor TaxID=1912936 RepID=A0A9P7JUQ0_9AGAM|nr:uncharacterized protein F5147DRAFT_652497 [Suillus discolor]KAG2108900.1 hypothetical protein F5147DRAFT_652497 [Suillus discolor]
MLLTFWFVILFATFQNAGANDKASISFGVYLETFNYHLSSVNIARAQKNTDLIITVSIIQGSIIVIVTAARKIQGLSSTDSLEGAVTAWLVHAFVSALIPGSLAQSTIMKPDFIRQFQLACNHGTQAIQDFLSSCPVAVEWWAEAARSLNPENFKDEGVLKMLNDMRNLNQFFCLSSTNVHVPTGISATSEATIQPLPLPLPANPLPAQQTPAGPSTKEAFVQYFHERFQGVDMDVTVKFLMQNLHSVPEEWQKVLFGSLAPEFKKELGHALTRAKASAASKTLPVTSAATPNTSSDRVPTVVQQSRTTTASNAVTPATAHTTSESSKSIPVPPRPSVTKNTQAKSTSVQPPRALTSNRTAATTVAPLATKATPAPHARKTCMEFFKLRNPEIFTSKSLDSRMGFLP